MLKKPVLVFALFALAACSSSQPRIIQASSNAEDIRVTSGMATQIEMPRDVRVQSVTTGNPSLVTAEAAGDVVNLIPRSGAGETNLIIRSRDDDGDTKVYQYRVIVQD